MLHAGRPIGGLSRLRPPRPMPGALSHGQRLPQPRQNTLFPSGSSSSEPASPCCSDLHFLGKHQPGRGGGHGAAGTNSIWRSHLLGPGLAAHPALGAVSCRLGCGGGALLVSPGGRTQKGNTGDTGPPLITCAARHRDLTPGFAHRKSAVTPWAGRGSVIPSPRPSASGLTLNTHTGVCACIHTQDRSTTAPQSPG